MREPIDNVIETAFQIAKENASSLTNTDLIKWNYLKSINQQNEKVKKKMVEVSKELDQRVIEKSTELGILTAIAAIPFLTEIKIDKMNTKNLVLLGDYLDESYYPNEYFNVSQIIGNDDLLTTVREKTTDNMKQCSILSYIEKTAYELNIEPTDQNKITFYQEKMIHDIKQEELEKLLEKSGYSQKTKEVEGLLDKIR